MKHLRYVGGSGSAATLVAALLSACASAPLAPKERPANVSPNGAERPSVADLTAPPAASASAASSDAGAPASEPEGESSLSAIFAPKGDDGLVKEDLQLGTGQSVQMGDMAKINYVGRLESGKEFDNSRNRPGAFKFTMGRGMVIKGFDRGMVGMKIGGIRRIKIPWKLGYGEQGSPPNIPPRANLIFEIELLDIPVPVPKPPPKGGGAPPPPQ